MLFRLFSDILYQKVQRSNAMSISFIPESKTFYLDGKNISYAFFINSYGYAEHLYFGKKIPHDDLTYSVTYDGANSFASTPPGKDAGYSYQQSAAELTFFGIGDYREPCVITENSDGSRLCELLYDGYEILETKPAISGMPSMEGGETLVLHLKDSVTDFAADLYYTVYDDCDVIARRIVYKNSGKEKVILRRAYSFSLSLPGHEYDFVSLYGAWAKERHIEKIPLHHGVVSVDSKRAASSAVLNPFIALAEKGASEESGNVVGISLVYSSSFVLKAQCTTCGDTVVTGGIQDFNFSWSLNPGEELEAPEAVIAFSSEGMGAMSRTFHRAFRNHLINKRYVKSPRPLLINNWEGTYFDFNTEKLNAMADAVADTGIDTFVLDDGWFGIRNDDTSGLGDWFVNTEKLPGGLNEVIDHIHSLGMKFGLWFEPEMISENSELYRAHPEYAIKAPGRPGCYGRHQFMLDLTNSEVRDYIVNSVNNILHTHEIDYVKWDYNRNVTEFYSDVLAAENQGEFCHRYALGVYDLCERIVEANPHIFFEGCSGGGARFDPAMLRYFPQIWTSDDTDAEERTLIQYGTSLVYPLSAMSCHVSKIPNEQTGRRTLLETRAYIASLGATGYEFDPTKLSAEELEKIRKYVKEYREIADLILNGDLYRIENPFESNFFGMAIVSEDKASAVLTAYRRLGSVNTETKRIKLSGLNDSYTYYIPELDIKLSGAVLMNVGLVPKFGPGDFKALRWHFIKQ